jgi:succinate-semialdehyde dehydrogenase / glutarate-semialdehyde dehydrogenase
MDMKTSPVATLNDAGLLKTDALIGGEWLAGAARFDVNDPATGLKLADVANLGAAESDAAIAVVLADHGQRR